MIYSVKGELLSRGDNFAVVAVGGLGLKIFMHRRAMAALPAQQNSLSLFCHLHVREDALDLYGFPGPEELNLFEQLISISGVGPKSALSVLDVAPLVELTSAIKEGRPDLLTQASGIGRKTAERIILELKSKVFVPESEATVLRMEADIDLLEALSELGYRKEDARSALQRIDPQLTTLEARLKEVLKILSKK